ncbi:MAG: hypothetical protein J6Y95_02590 [Lachnospiraceae bacterium]|nr:hypothetical protein [Lachnospiraceae bacterium]
MKKAFKYYLIAWAIMFVLFNLVAILLPNQVTIGNFTYTKFGGLSLVTFILFELCFLGHLACTWYAMKQDKLSGTFYRIPMIRISYACIIVTLILGCVAMAVPMLPSWIPMLLVLLIMAAYVITVLKVAATADVVEQIDEKVAKETSFIKDLTADANALIARANTDEAREACKKVYEAIRYSDPRSNEKLAGVEAEITAEFGKFVTAVKEGNAEIFKAAAEEILALVKERNEKCKVDK